MAAVVPLKTSMLLIMAAGNSRRSAERPPVAALAPPASEPLVFRTVMPSMSTRVRLRAVAAHRNAPALAIVAAIERDARDAGNRFIDVLIGEAADILGGDGIHRRRAAFFLRSIESVGLRACP